LQDHNVIEEILMVNFRVVVSDPKDGKAYQLELDDKTSRKLFGLGIGDTFDGSIIGLDGYRLLITGGTDRDGFPQRRDLPGTGKKRILLAGGVGYRPKERGKRVRKMIRGRVISEEISQINTKIVSYGSKPLAEIAGKEDSG